MTGSQFRLISMLSVVLLAGALGATLIYGQGGLVIYTPSACDIPSACPACIANQRVIVPGFNGFADCQLTSGGGFRCRDNAPDQSCGWGATTQCTGIGREVNVQNPCTGAVIPNLNCAGDMITCVSWTGGS
jgi:hypothetical protein